MASAALERACNGVSEAGLFHLIQIPEIDRVGAEFLNLGRSCSPFDLLDI